MPPQSMPTEARRKFPVRPVMLERNMRRRACFLCDSICAEEKLSLLSHPGVRIALAKRAFRNTLLLSWIAWLSVGGCEAGDRLD